jgi:hypothetical protein
MDKEILALLREAGRTLTVRRQTIGNYTPASGVSGESTTNVSVTGVIVDWKDEYDGQWVQHGDRKAIIAASGLSFTLTKKDAIIDGSTVYKIIDLQKITWKSATVAYICQVRV